MDTDDIIACAAYNTAGGPRSIKWEKLLDVPTGDFIRDHWLAQARALRSALNKAGFDIVMQQPSTGALKEELSK